MFSEERATKNWSGGELDPSSATHTEYNWLDVHLKRCAHDTAGPIHHSSCTCLWRDRGEERVVICTNSWSKQCISLVPCWCEGGGFTGKLDVWAEHLSAGVSGVTVAYTSPLLHENTEHCNMPHAIVRRTAWPISETVTRGEEESDMNYHRGVPQSGWGGCMHTHTHTPQNPRSWCVWAGHEVSVLFAH